VIRGQSLLHVCRKGYTWVDSNNNGHAYICITHCYNPQIVLVVTMDIFYALWAIFQAKRESSDQFYGY
jgi:hypothetical protein